MSDSAQMRTFFITIIAWSGVGGMKNPLLVRQKSVTSPLPEQEFPTTAMPAAEEVVMHVPFNRSGIDARPVVAVKLGDRAQIHSMILSTVMKDSFIAREGAGSVYPRTELARIQGGTDEISFPVTVKQTEARNSGLGAARTSAFAKTAKVFTLVPGRRSGAPGGLLIGDHSIAELEARHCGLGMQFVPLNASFASVWVVGGSVSLGDRRPESVNWLIDTQITGWVVPQSAREQVFEAIRRNGGIVDPSTEFRFVKVTNCPSFRLLPQLTITIGHDLATATVLHISPEEYMWEGMEGQCSVRLEAGNRLGVEMLKRLVTMFDLKRNRMGFCPIHTTDEVEMTRKPATRRPARGVRRVIDDFIAALAPLTTAEPEAVGSGPLGQARIGMHYSGDDRPRVNVRFLGHDRPEMFSFMFDTGSEVSLVFEAREGRFGAQAGYTARRGSVANSVESVHHVVGTSTQIHTFERFREMAQLLSHDDSFSFETALHLSDQRGESDFGVGLLGAGRTSAFAEAARVFALIPPRTRSWYRPGTAAGELIVGRRDFGLQQEEFCSSESSLDFVPLNLEISRDRWIVPGSVGSNTEAPESVNWSIETGASGWYVPQNIFDQITQAIAAQGDSIDPPSEPKGYMRIRECRNIRALPVLSFSVGSVTVRVPPTEYVARSLSGRCSLTLRVQDSPIIGTGLLSKLFTVFDRENNRVGFCMKK